MSVSLHGEGPACKRRVTNAGVASDTMRLWTIHPCHLDARGLVALWREALLARAVLAGRTRGYRHHPQLSRFRRHPRPRAAINSYLSIVLTEAVRRGYRFDARKVGRARTALTIAATRGQLRHEWRHLLAKLEQRAPEMHRQVVAGRPTPHPLFRVRRGRVESWERRA